MPQCFPAVSSAGSGVKPCHPRAPAPLSWVVGSVGITGGPVIWGGNSWRNLRFDKPEIHKLIQIHSESVLRPGQPWGGGPRTVLSHKAHVGTALARDAVLAAPGRARLREGEEREPSEAALVTFRGAKIRPEHVLAVLSQGSRAVRTRPLPFLPSCEGGASWGRGRAHSRTRDSPRTLHLCFPKASQLRPPVTCSRDLRWARGSVDVRPASWALTHHPRPSKSQVKLIFLVPSLPLCVCGGGRVSGLFSKKQRGLSIRVQVSAK